MNWRPGFNNRQTVFGLALLTAWLPATLAMAQMSYRYSGSTTATPPVSDSSDISTTLGSGQSSSTYTPRAGSRAALEQRPSSDDAVQPASVLKMPDEPAKGSSTSNTPTNNSNRVYTAQRTSAQSAEAVKPRTYTTSGYRQADSTMPPAPPVINGQSGSVMEETPAPTGSLFAGPHVDSGSSFMGSGNGGCGCGHCPPGGGSCASCSGGCNGGGCNSGAYDCGFGIGSFFSNLFSCDCNGGCASGGCNGGGCNSGGCNSGGCNSGGCSSGACGNSGGCSSGSCNGGGCSSGGCGSCNGNGGFGICIGFCNCNFMDNLTVYAGADSFAGGLDGNTHGNFGFTAGLNTGFCISEGLGLGLQMGSQITEADFEPTFFASDTRTQIFVTGGAFHRPTCGRGWDIGAVIDYLHDDYYTQFDLTQVRGRLGYEFGCNQIGFEFSQHLDTERFTDPRGALFVNFGDTYGAQDRYVAVFSHNFCEGAEARLYAGVTSHSDGIVGAEVRAPLSDSWSVHGGFDYLLPEGGVAGVGAVPNSAESWNVGCALEWHPHSRARCYGSDPYRPMFDVANNGWFMLRQR